MMVAGFFIHLAGIFGDGSMAARVYVKKTEWFRTLALILVSLYTLAWLGWLITLLVLRYRHTGQVCSGYYLNDNDGTPVNGYAIKQG